MPRYGAFVRVDDAVMEAFRIWPTGRVEADGPGRLEVVGGWFNGHWRSGLRRSAITFPTDLMLTALAAQRAKPEPTLPLAPLDATADEWECVEIVLPEQGGEHSPDIVLKYRDLFMQPPGNDGLPPMSRFCQTTNRQRLIF